MLETSTSPGSARRPDPGADVDRHAADVVADQLDLAGVDPGPHVDPEAGDIVLDRAGAADRPRRPVEGGEEAVAHRLHLVAAVAGKLAADGGVVAFEQRPPAAIPQLRRLLGRADDVGEEDRRQRPFGLGRAAAADQELLDLVEDASRSPAKGR